MSNKRALIGTSRETVFSKCLLLSFITADNRKGIGIFFIKTMTNIKEKFNKKSVRHTDNPSPMRKKISDPSLLINPLVPTQLVKIGNPS
jgi:hypothetical protein